MTHLKKLYEEIHSDENAILDQYREAGMAGKQVVAVNVKSQEEVDRARAELEKHHAENVRYFGLLQVKDLSVPRPDDISHA